MRRIEEQILSSRPDRSVALYASAGSGKTRALVMRLMHLMLAGIPPGNIAAVTFTEKAAAEMKDRLFRQLEEASRKGADGFATIGIDEADAPFGLKMTPDALYSALLAEPEALKVQTIHALCLWLIRRFPLDSGLLPGFELADEARSAMLMDEAVEDLFSELARTGNLADVDTLYGCGVSIRYLKDSLMRALGMRSQLRAVELAAGGPEAFIRSLEDAVYKTATAYDDFFATKELARLATEMKNTLGRYGIEDVADGGYWGLIGHVSGMTDRQSFEDGFRDCAYGFLTEGNEPRKRYYLTKTALEKALRSSGNGLKGKALKASVEEVQALHIALQDDFIEACELHDTAVSAAGLLSFWRVYRAAEERYAAVKNASVLADFDDLEIGAYNLLAGPHGIEALLDVEPRLLHYLVDEFQDTSDMQWELISALASEVFAGAGAEWPKSSTLFAVGDMKQSIYRFRNANYRLMERLRSLMEDRIPEPEREVLELTSNFRSAPEVLDVVNETFSALMEDEYSPSVNKDNNRTGSVRLVVAEEPEVGTLAGQVMRYYGVSVWDTGSGDYRPAGYGDMAVLLRSRAMLPDIEAEFTSRGIPYRVVGGVGFFKRPEIRALVALLRFVDDPDDRLSLEVALRSGMFVLSAEESHRLFTSPDLYGTLHELRPEAHSLLGSLREKSGLVTCGELVDAAVFESGAAVSFSPGNPAAPRNLVRLGRLAHGFDRTQGGGLGGFLRWLEDYERLSDAGAADPVADGEDGGGYVSIMTVHGAKGLEFPVVFLPGMTRSPGGRPDGLLVGGRDFDRVTLRTSSYLREPPAYAELREEERLERRLESHRLLYVAMTRARDHLVMTAGTGKRPVQPGSWFFALREASPPSLFGDDASDVKAPFEAAYPTDPPALHPDASPPEKAGDTRIKPPDPYMLRPIQPQVCTVYVSPSALATEADTGVEPEAPWPPSLRGSIMHALLESFGRTGAYDATATASRFPGFRNLPGAIRDQLVSDMEETLGQLLDDAGIRGLITDGERRYHELELLVRDGDRIAYGSADLVTVTGETARVVDYKTGYTRTGADAIKEAFAPQLRLYGRAVEHALGTRPPELVLILVDKAEAVYL